MQCNSSHADAFPFFSGDSHQGAGVANFDATRAMDIPQVSATMRRRLQFGPGYFDLFRRVPRIPARRIALLSTASERAFAKSALGGTMGSRSLRLLSRTTVPSLRRGGRTWRAAFIAGLSRRCTMSVRCGTAVTYKLPDLPCVRCNLTPRCRPSLRVNTSALTAKMACPRGRWTSKP